MTQELVLRTGKHTYTIWRPFSVLLLPTVSPLTWKNAFSQPPSLEILGHTISATGVAPTVDHAAEIKNCPPPQDIKTFFWHGKLLLPLFGQLLKF
jgi:hypothetical protein